MNHSAELDLDQFIELEGEPIFEFDVFSYFYDQGYPIDEVQEAHSIVHKKQNDEDTAHIVIKIQTLSKPIDEADVAADTHEMYCCDCKGFQFHYDTDLEENPITEWGICPHIERVDKTAKAANDENQETIV